ncbi:type IV pilus modification protein PilV [Marinospirillum perlucidum]|uniref:type IV pilus modification protein PilV n=1 Tax=Marinospirillum perlucidum TaxID=1982602 RepID=UPI000DF2A758|nr:type IV pilus modification protein PilV [Marinospirillum perlucidum]
MKGPIKKQQGFSLIEVLVAVFVITFGLVGMVLMQTHSQRDAFKAHQLSLAGLYAQDMQERLRSNLCYLNHTANGPETTTELETFLDNQLDEWRSAHQLTARGWTSSWQNVSYDASQLNSNGYWQFELRLLPPNPSTQARVQTLLIDYRDEDCSS